MSLSHMIENPDGRVFLHSLGAGACLLVVERDGVNTSLMLSPTDALTLGRALFIELGGERRSAGMSAYSVDVDEYDVPVTPKALPPAKTRYSAPRGSRTDGFYEEVARIYMLDEGRSYHSTKHDKHGRVALVMDRMGMTFHPARNAVDKARKRGLMGNFRAEHGRPLGWSPNGNGRVDA